MPGPPTPCVAVIGGGIAGLVTANRLKDLGMDSVVFDTGKHLAGGRASTRQVNIGGRPHWFDHSCQAFTVSSPHFQQLVSLWAGCGVVQQWGSDGQTVGSLGPGGAFKPRSGRLPPLWIGGHQGMRSLVQHLASQVTVRQPVWVSAVQRRVGDGRWDVFGDGRRHAGTFDYIVIAHNGKCADRLMSTAGVSRIHELLKVKFCPKPGPQQVMQLCSVWVFMVAFPTSLGLPYQGAFVEGVPELSWVANNTSKIAANRPQPAAGASGGAGAECWTVVSSREFGAQHKVPQESIPPEKDKEVKSLMLQAFARATGLPLLSLKPCYQRVQLWGAAVPLNTGSAPCVFDAESCVGIAGDWLVSPNVEGAALSGRAMADKIYAHWHGKERSSVGLDCRFKPVGTQAIGAFATAPAAGVQATAPAAGVQASQRSAPNRGSATEAPDTIAPDSSSATPAGDVLQRGQQAAGAAGPQAVASRGSGQAAVVPGSDSRSRCGAHGSNSGPGSWHQGSVGGSSHILYKTTAQRSSLPATSPTQWAQRSTCPGEECQASGGVQSQQQAGIKAPLPKDMQSEGRSVEDLRAELQQVQARLEELSGPAARNARKRLHKRAQALEKQLGLQ